MNCLCIILYCIIELCCLHSQFLEWNKRQVSPLDLEMLKLRLLRAVLNWLEKRFTVYGVNSDSSVGHKLYTKSSV